MKMLFWTETIVLCLVFWGICVLATGTDERNLRNLSSYPDEIQRWVRSDPILGPKVGMPSGTSRFCSNLLLYTIVLLFACCFVREEGFLKNFRTVFWMGELLNLFDFFVVDLLWWRHTRRVRFVGTEHEAQRYRDPKNHFVSFLKGIVLFFLVGVIDGALLSFL